MLTDQTPYILRDMQTGNVLHVYTYADRNRARRYRDVLNRQYGATRYILTFG